MNGMKVSAVAGSTLLSLGLALSTLSTAYGGSSATLRVSGSLPDLQFQTTTTITDMEFDLGTANTLSQSLFTFTSSTSLTIKVYLDGGQNLQNGNLRNMKLEGTSSAGITTWSYNLYTDSARSLVWGDAGATTPVSWVYPTFFAGQGFTKTYNIYGRAYGKPLLTTEQRAVLGGKVFSDRVTVTVEY